MNLTDKDKVILNHIQEYIEYFEKLEKYAKDDKYDYIIEMFKRLSRTTSALMVDWNNDDDPGVDISRFNKGDSKSE